MSDCLHLKRILPFMLLLFISTGCSAEQAEQQVYEQYYESGELKGEYTYLGEKQHGLAKEFYRDGSLKGEWNFKDDEYHGSVKQYYPDSSLKAEGYFVDGKQEGVTKKYYPDGQLKGEWSFKNGMLNGKSIEFYQNGNIMVEWNYKNDVLDGESKEYFESGKIKTIENFKEGRLLDEQGNLKNGEYRDLNEDGSLAGTVVYSDGIPSNERKAYHINGKLAELWIYNDNGEAITVKKFDENGELISDLNQKQLEALNLNNLAYSHFESGIDLNKGLEVIEKALEMEPENGHFLSTKAELFYEMGEFEDAKKFIDLALKFEPDEDGIKESAEFINYAFEKFVK